MVADDEIHALSLRIGYLLRGFDAAVEGDDERHPLAGGVIDSLDGDTVPFGVAVRYVKEQVAVADVPQELVDQRHGRRSVHVVVAVDHDLLLVADGCLDTLHGAVHVLHQEGVVEVRELRIEKRMCLLFGVYASLYEQVSQHGRNPQRRGERLHGRGVALRFDNPSFFYRHTVYLLYILTSNFSLKTVTIDFFTSSIGMFGSSST